MKLFEKYEVNNTVFKNRLVMLPMCTYSSFNEDGVISEFHRAHYASRAIGQTGYIIIEATGVSPNGRITDNCLGLYTDEQRDQLKTLVTSLHTFDTKVGIQLNHAGRKCKSKDEIVAPSPIAFSENHRLPHELSIEEVSLVIQDFKAAAKRADEAGFDAIEIHAAHGYLINQFISPITNKRSDKYSDPKIFLEELITEITSVWPQEKLLTIRISHTDYEELGYDVNNIIELLKPYKDVIDIVNVSSGAVTNKVPESIYPGYQVEAATTIKNALEIPVICGGLINDLDLALDILENSRADFIGMGRNLLRNPQWLIEQAKKYGYDSIVPMQYERAY